MASDLFHPYLLGGGETRMYETARRLARKHEIHVLTRKFKGLPSYELHEDIHIHRVFIPSERIKLESFADGSAFMAGTFIKGLSLGDFDVYAPQQFFPIFPLWLIAKARARPLVATIHDVYRGTWLQKYGSKGYLMAAFERLMLRLAYTKIITVSSSSKQKLIESGVPEHKIEIIPNGVDVKKYDRVKVKKSDRPRVIYVGRLIGYKHVDDLLVSFSRLGFDAELYIVGEGPERKNLEALAQRLKIDQKVTFTGFVSELQKIKLIKSSHALVLPSVTEGFGIVLVEAMAARTPVIAADIPALRELVGNEEVGLLFAPRDVGSLREKLNRLLRESELREMLSQKGYEFVKRRFSWDEIAKEVEYLLEAV